jgi:hypothetical protein
VQRVGVNLGQGSGTVKDVEVQDILQELVKIWCMHPSEKMSIGVQKMYKRKHSLGKIFISTELVFMSMI